jgi:hypothetical protein
VNAATHWELDALSRLSAARDQLEAIITGHHAAEVRTVDAIVRLTASAAVSLRHRDACRGMAA